MSLNLKAALVCVCVAVGCTLVAITASGAFFVAGKVVSDALEPRVGQVYPALESDVGYDERAYDACMDSSDDVSEEDCLSFAQGLEVAQ